MLPINVFASATPSSVREPWATYKIPCTVINPPFAENRVLPKRNGAFSLYRYTAGRFNFLFDFQRPTTGRFIPCPGDECLRLIHITCMIDECLREAVSPSFCGLPGWQMPAGGFLKWRVLFPKRASFQRGDSFPKTDRVCARRTGEGGYETFSGSLQRAQSRDRPPLLRTVPRAITRKPH